jgi:hypothetical protein
MQELQHKNQSYQMKFVKKYVKSKMNQNQILFPTFDIFKVARNLRSSTYVL